MTYITKGSPSYKKTNIALFTGGFASFAVLYSIQPLIPEISDQFRVSAAAASIALSATTVMLGIFMIAASMLSDAIGRRSVMVASLFMTSLFAILTAFSPNYSFLLIMRALAGVSIAGFPSIAMTYINEEFHPRTVGTSMGIYVSGTTLGGLSARVSVGALTDWFSWNIALLVIGGLCLVISFWFWKHMPGAAHFTPQTGQVKRILPAFGRHMLNPVLVCFFVLAFLLTGSFDTLFNYIGYPLMASPYNVSQAAASMIFLVFLAGTFSSAVMGNVADRIGKGKTLSSSIVIMLAGGLLTLHGFLWLKIVGAAIYAGGFFGAHSVASSWVGQSTTLNKSLASSIYLFFFYVGSSFVGPLGGVFWNNYGWSGVIIMNSVFIFIALIISGIIPTLRAKSCSVH